MPETALQTPMTLPMSDTPSAERVETPTGDAPDG